uniref:E3 ubiquitin/ISG15 ligase TRIM25-like n=1 Tax=Oreochromis aureus TaxID=47969 RepID=A0A668U3G4_OREAU
MQEQTASLTSALVSEDSLLCPVCLSVFTKPVSIPCGHNFCLDCITDYWSTLSVLQCPLCKEMFYTRPLLRVNPVIDEMAEKVKKSVQEMLLSSAEEAGNEDVLCDYCTGSKVSAQKSCLMCLVSYCQKHLEPHQRISALKKHKLIDPVKDLENRVCQDHGKPLELICRLDQMFLCQSCKCGDHKTHETVALEDEDERRKTQLRSENTSMDQMIQEREQKIQEVQQSLKTSRSKAEEALLYSRKVMTALVEHIKTEFTRLSEAIETEQKINETEAESFINELEGEITHIKKKKLHFHEASLIRDPFRFLENVLPLTYNKPQLKDWSAVTVTSDQFMIQETMAELETKVREEVSTLCNINFRGGKQQRYDLNEEQQSQIQVQHGRFPCCC